MELLTERKSMKNNAVAHWKALATGLIGKILHLVAILSSASLDKAEHHSGSFCSYFPPTRCVV